MQLKDTQEAYQYYSGKTSDIVRQLAFAGLAVIWVFKTDAGGRQIINPQLLLAGIFLILGLTLDFLHYVVGTLVWGAYNRKKEKQLKHTNKEFLAPPKINWPTIILFW